MRVLFTGDAGHVGRPVVSHLTDVGHEVIGFDRVRGQDLADADALVAAATGCDAVVHAAALAHDSAGDPAAIMATNVGGTWNALRAAEEVGARTFVYFLSAQVFGTAEGEQLPDYIPIDDRHPRNASRPYGLSKRFAEDLCAVATRRTGLATVALRPVGVWLPETYDEMERARRDQPAFEWVPFWEFGGFVDVRDVATAVESALHVPPASHVRATLCSVDISASAPTIEMVAQLIPSVPWQTAARAAFEREPWRALFDTSTAREALGWTPAHTWASR